VKEIGYNAPIEAIKAQTIAARTYAISHKDMYINYGFDITDKYQQVYGGYLSENEKVNSAIDDTKDLVMFYDNKPIKAFYFTSSGGVTEGAENVWGKGEPYLVSVLDEYDLKRKDTSKWMIEFTTDEIQQKLKNKNIDIGKLLDIDVAERSKSRRVIELKYIGSLSTYTLTKNDVRSLLNLKSQLFWIEKENDVYRFYGKGSGHGVGLSQVGAMGMADAGFSFFDILNHYFTGVEIREL
jgi:stage II sporulation protein D